MATKMQDLKAEIRQEIGTKKLGSLRNSGFVPAVLYGKGRPSLALKVNYKELEKVLNSEAGINSIINLKITGGQKAEEQAAITCDLDKNVLNDKIIHIDFHALELKEKLQTMVPVTFVGEAPGVKEGAGILVTVLHELKIECLPLDIPSHLNLDISGLALNKALHVADVKVDEKKIKILNPAEDVVVSCILPKEEVVEEVVAEGVQPEVIGKEKEEGEEGAEEGEAKGETKGEVKGEAKGKAEPAKAKAEPAGKEAPGKKPEGK